MRLAPLPSRRPYMGPSARAILLLVLTLAPSLTGCWTRLTTPKESFLYQTPQGEAPETAAVARVFTAPQYQTELEKIEAKLGPQSYRMVVGTQVAVEVYGHGIKESLNIRPDGMIDLPLVGDVMAEGKTIPEFKKEVAGLYRPFYQQEPQIIINTQREHDLIGPGVRAGDVSVIGSQGSTLGGSGVVNITGDEHLSQILASSNGLNRDAEWRQVAIIRRSRDQKESAIIICDMERLIKNGDTRQDILMRNGDIVFVPVERHTLIQEIWLTLGLVAQLTGNVNTITDYVERVERY